MRVLVVSTRGLNTQRASATLPTSRPPLVQSVSTSHNRIFHYISIYHFSLLLSFPLPSTPSFLASSSLHPSHILFFLSPHHSPRLPFHLFPGKPTPFLKHQSFYPTTCYPTGFHPLLFSFFFLFKNIAYDIIESVTFAPLGILVM
jgi:hypothetical protein